MIPFEAAVAQLVGLGFSRDAAEREVTRQLVVIPARRNGKSEAAGRIIGNAIESGVEVFLPTRYPFRLTLPWSALESDDDKYGAVIVNTGTGKLIPKLILQASYRAAKSKARDIARAAMLGNPVSIPLQLVARVWLPDNRPGHDVANFAKCAHDALEKVVYTSDQWLHDVRWIRAGVDVDRPRAEITITPL